MDELREIVRKLDELTWQLDDKYIFEINCAIDHIEEVLKKMENKD